MTGLVKTGRTAKRDMNYFSEFVAAPEAKGCVWLKRGTLADVADAAKKMGPEGYSVFSFDASERDPIGKAKKMALEAFEKVQNV